jgi:hypothetical protein
MRSSQKEEQGSGGSDLKNEFVKWGKSTPSRVRDFYRACGRELSPLPGAGRGALLSTTLSNYGRTPTMIYKLALALSLSLAAANDIHKDPEWNEFSKFIQTHRNGLSYRDEAETIARFAIFKDNLRTIRERNAKGQERHGVTKFADLSAEEFRAKHTGLRPASTNALKKLRFLDHGVGANYTTSSIDWNAKGALTPVRASPRLPTAFASRPLPARLISQRVELPRQQRMRPPLARRARSPRRAAADQEPGAVRVVLGVLGDGAAGVGLLPQVRRPPFLHQRPALPVAPAPAPRAARRAAPGSPPHHPSRARLAQVRQAEGPVPAADHVVHDLVRRLRRRQPHRRVGVRQLVRWAGPELGLPVPLGSDDADGLVRRFELGGDGGGVVDDRVHDLILARAGVQHAQADRVRANVHRRRRVDVV